MDQHGTSAIKSALTVPNCRDWPKDAPLLVFCLDDALDTAEARKNDRRRQALSPACLLIIGCGPLDQGTWD